MGAMITPLTIATPYTTTWHTLSDVRDEQLLFNFCRGIKEALGCRRNIFWDGFTSYLRPSCETLRTAALPTWQTLSHPSGDTIFRSRQPRMGICFRSCITKTVRLHEDNKRNKDRTCWTNHLKDRNGWTNHAKERNYDSGNEVARSY